MKRQGTYLELAVKKPRTNAYVKPKRVGYTTVARTRGVYAAGEMKYFDVVKAVTTITPSADWTGTEYDPAVTNTLFCPAQGAGINQRIGKACKVHKIKIRGQIICPSQTNQVAADAPTVVRLALVWDKQTNSTQAQGEQVFGGPVTGSSIVSIDNYQNIDNFGRFVVMKDKTFTFQNPNMSWDGTNIEQAGLIKKFKWNINLKTPVEVRFNAVNGQTVADIVDNSWHIIANASTADLGASIVYFSRFCYKE